ncbi:uncharacterized protein LOC124556553 [Schistocerca americana]|uniref:uncharacterized protein LOC124556553 n=1 Tax=Schistocerca americana TaxID=7009 RepID=UPI001F4FB2D0|nr:uncharacterized protein LOC124556553 [Schistocerca americana]
MVRVAAMMLLLLQLCAVLVHTGYAFPNVTMPVSSLKRALDGEGPDAIQRQVEMAWQPVPDAEWVGLFDVSPPQKAQDAAPLVRWSASEHPGGCFRTSVSFPRQEYPNGWNKGSEEEPVEGDACMPFWLAIYDKNDELLHSDCIKIRPTWMADHREELENLTVADLFIPGTNGSDTNNGSVMENTSERHGCYVLTQDADVWGQLVHGIRYIDIDVRDHPGNKTTTYAPATQDDDGYRQIVNVDAVRDILEEIKAYLKKAHSEIIVLDIHDFEGPAGNRCLLLSMVYSVLGHFMSPFNSVSYNSTLAEVWKTGVNVIVTYNNPETIEGLRVPPI